MFEKGTLQAEVSRSLPVRLLLLILWLVLPALSGLALAQDTGLRFLEPTFKDIPLGDTRFLFEVRIPLDTVDVYANGLLVGTAKPPDWQFTAKIPGTHVGAEYVAIGFVGEKPKARARVKTRQVRVSEEVDVVRVQLFPVVRGIGGQFVSDLKAGDFQVFDNSTPVRISSFEQQAKNLSIAVLLDVSESMRASLHILGNAATEFSGKLADTDRISVLSFNDQLKTIVPWTQDRERTRRGIRSLRAGGHTALYDSIVRVIESFEHVEGRKVLLVFSDGRDLESVSSAERVVRRAQESEVIIYTIGPSQGKSLVDLRETLEFLAGETGGEAYLVDDPASFPRIFDRVIRHLRAQYELAFIPVPGSKGLHKVEVRVTRPGLRAHARQSYYLAESGRYRD